MKVRVALLLHQVPDGSSHVDVLVARDDRPLGDDDREVPTWRCSTRPDLAPNGSVLSLDRIGDHRALYLRLPSERQLDGGRGTVQPLRAGTAELSADILTVAWDDEGESWWSVREGDHGWQLRVQRNLATWRDKAECREETGRPAFPTTDDGSCS